MILYHFTSLYNLGNVGPDNIIAVGLKPSAIGWEGCEHAPDSVWLTIDPDLPSVGHIASFSEVRVTVVIPSADKRLVRWEKWVRKHSSDRIVEVANKTWIGWRSFWVYFGSVPPERIRVIEYTDPALREKMSKGEEIPDDYFDQ
jgi:hypothetical protein